MASPTSPLVLSAHIERVQLQRHTVLHNIDFHAEAGRWLAIVGPNGAGKSTLLRTLAGLLPYEGEVQLMEKPLAAWPAKERARRLSWLGQGEQGSDELRAFDVVMLGRLPHQAWLAPPSASDEEAVHWAMQQTQSWDWRLRRMNELSGGERQRVLLARALAVQASVILMDEPLAHLDPPHQADWLGLVRQLRDQGITVISVLHELNMALCADELVVMRDGRVMHQGLTQDPQTQTALMDVFEHRVQLHRIASQWVALPCTPTLT